MLNRRSLDLESNILAVEVIQYGQLRYTLGRRAKIVKDSGTGSPSSTT